MVLDLHAELDGFTDSPQEIRNGTGMGMTTLQIRHLGDRSTGFILLNQYGVGQLTHRFLPLRGVYRKTLRPVKSDLPRPRRSSGRQGVIATPSNQAVPVVPLPVTSRRSRAVAAPEGAVNVLV